MKLLLFIFGFLGISSYAAAQSCSQVQIEERAAEAAVQLSKRLNATRVVLGKGTYEGPSGNVKAYFPVFFSDANCEDDGLSKCNQSGVLFGNLSTCTISSSGPINSNLLEQ